MKRIGTLLAGLVLTAHVAVGADLFSPGFKLQDPTDPTKTATFDLSGLSTGTSPVFALPAGGGTLALTSMIPPAGPTPGSNSTVIVSNGTIFQNKMVPLCADTGGQHLNFDTATNTFTCGTSSSAPTPPLATFTGQTAARVYTLRDANTSIATRSSALTAGRLHQTDANGELFDTANLTFSDTLAKLTLSGTGPAECFHTSLTGYCIVGGGANSLRVMNEAGTAWLTFSALSLRVASSGQVTFSNSTNPESTVDTGLSRATVGVVKATNAAAGQGWLQNTAGVTGNAGDWTNATTTLANDNGLTRDLVAGQSYTFRLLLFTNDGDSTEGLKLDFAGGGVVATNFRAHCTVYDSTPALVASAQVTSLSTAVVAASVSGAAQVECSGTIEPSTSGSLIVRAAQNVHNAGTLTVTRGSHLLIENVPLQTAYNFQILALGDSKTIGSTCCDATGGYRPTLITNLLATGHWATVGYTGVNAVSGITTGSFRGQFIAFLAAQTLQPDWVLINLGSNDTPHIHDGSQTQTAWLSDMGIVLDAIHVRWPSTKVRLMRILNTSYLTECNTLAGWMDTVVASRSAWAAVGPDERVFLPGHLADITHPDASGYVLTASQWQTTMGY